MIPDALELVVLVLAAFRLTRLVGWDEITGPLRDRLTGAEQDAAGWTFRRPRLAAFLACPYCLGFWLSLAVYIAWLSAPRPTLYAMTPFAISGLVGLIARNLDSD